MLYKCESEFTAVACLLSSRLIYLNAYFSHQVYAESVYIYIKYIYIYTEISTMCQEGRVVRKTHTILRV